MIILLGSKGQLGTSIATELAKKKHEFFAVDNTSLDVTDKAAVLNFVDILRPQIIINASAYTNVGLAEEQPAIANKVNHDAVQHIWQSALKVFPNKNKLPVIFHYSTDYVFDGTLGKDYKESDKTNPLNQYGISKRKGEESLSSYERYFVFRTSWLFSKHGPNFIRTISNKLIDGSDEPLRIVNDQFGSPTSARLLAKMSVNIISKITGQNFVENCHTLRDQYGVYHFSGTGKHSWFDFGQTIRTYMSLYSSKSLRKIISQSSAASKVKRPHNSVLDCSKISAAFNLGEEYFNWEKDCHDCIQDILKQ